ncbi:DUF3800 domain-containing protein [Albidovulum sediminis]|uniref:DUF3800 domain-containing protein n=1 Tax=Albidovulum sediminis TaxID=3066345 RepID=A0ABT2NGI1_9RHOB|nr:DUF3800 domain-containing protein [Defluviimonas sediminis]MCT8328014.1 DUF3800 domain-containing protein [Defluviimonas sediminis]
MVKICYVDEAGCTGTLESATSSIQPTLAITGLIVDYSSLHKLTSDMIEAKQRFFPRLLPATATHLDWIRAEVKGAELRKQACQSSRNEKRHAFGVIDKVTALCAAASAKIVGRVWVKGIGTPMNGTSVYTYSIQSIYQDFQKYLERANDIGFVVSDSRVHHLNTQVAHSVFTQKFKGTGDTYDRIVELPAFSHSDNHAGLQLIDLVCSAIITPIAIETCCKGHVTSPHVRPGYTTIKERYKIWLRESQFRYNEASGRTRGGLTVSDGISQKPGGALFR